MCSHSLRLSGREWIVVVVVLLALMVLAPAIGERLEGFHPDSDYRVPYELGSDYWHYRRYCRSACAADKTLVVGDSVIWGHYVSPDGTLAHYLNELSGSDRFANLGVDGTHPAALHGLLKHYARDISARRVLLHFNPLWMTSKKHDLQTEKEFRFNHPKLVPQFRPRIPCYTASFSTRLWAVTERHMPFFSWTSHLRTAYYDNMGLPAWTMGHPYANPLAVAGNTPPDTQSPEQPAVSTQRQVRKQDFSWVEPETSLQWRFFRRAVSLLKRRGNDVFVLVGPFNEHMLSDRAGAAYQQIKAKIEAWLQENNIPHLIPAPLPAELYVDTSHPIAEGYALLAKQLLADSSLKSRLSTSSATLGGTPDRDLPEER